MLGHSRLSPTGIYLTLGEEDLRLARGRAGLEARGELSTVVILGQIITIVGAGEVWSGEGTLASPMGGCSFYKLPTLESGGGVCVYRVRATAGATVDTTNKECVMADRVGREGQQLGNYRLLRLLGRGGFAAVYLGEHIHLNSHAAVKLLHTRLPDEDAQQFLHEAQLLARLAHPHIVRILDFAIQDGTPFLVMEYAPGGTLRSLHPKATQVPLEAVVSYVTQVASALQYAHDQNLVHRDVKPENMVLEIGRAHV